MCFYEKLEEEGRLNELERKILCKMQKVSRKVTTTELSWRIKGAQNSEISKNLEELQHLCFVEPVLSNQTQWWKITEKGKIAQREIKKGNKDLCKVGDKILAEEI